MGTEVIEAGNCWCEELCTDPNDCCTPCKDKRLLISVACAFAFDVGLSPSPTDESWKGRSC